MDVASRGWSLSHDQNFYAKRLWADADPSSVLRVGTFSSIE